MDKPTSPMGILATSRRYEEYYKADPRLESEFRAMRAVMLTSRVWARSLEHVIRSRTGQTRVRWEMLFAIAFADGETTASAIAQNMGVRWPALVRILDALEADGLIARRGNPEDGRSRLIELTSQGHETIKMVRATVDPARSETLSEFTDEELGLLVRLNERLYAKVKET